MTKEYTVEALMMGFQIADSPSGKVELLVDALHRFEDLSTDQLKDLMCRAISRFPGEPHALGRELQTFLSEKGKYGLAQCYRSIHMQKALEIYADELDRDIERRSSFLRKNSKEILNLALWLFEAVGHSHRGSANELLRTCGERLERREVEAAIWALTAENAKIAQWLKEHNAEAAASLAEGIIKAEGPRRVLRRFNEAELYLPDSANFAGLSVEGVKQALTAHCDAIRNPSPEQHERDRMVGYLVAEEGPERAMRWVRANLSSNVVGSMD